MACDIPTLALGLFLALRFSMNGDLPIQDPQLQCRTESKYGMKLRGACIERDGKVRKQLENWVSSQLDVINKCIRQGRVEASDLPGWKAP